MKILCDFWAAISDLEKKKKKKKKNQKKKLSITAISYHY